MLKYVHSARKKALELITLTAMPVTDINPLDFGKLFMKYKDSYIAIARSYVRDLAVAEDIVSESFTTFWDKRENIDIKTTPRSLHSPRSEEPVPELAP